MASRRLCISRLLHRARGIHADGRHCTGWHKQLRAAAAAPIDRQPSALTSPKWRRGEYVVMPAHSSGAAASMGRPSGRCSTNLQGRGARRRSPEQPIGHQQAAARGLAGPQAQHKRTHWLRWPAVLPLMLRWHSCVRGSPLFVHDDVRGVAAPGDGAALAGVGCGRPGSQRGVRKSRQRSAAIGCRSRAAVQRTAGPLCAAALNQLRLCTRYLGVPQLQPLFLPQKLHTPKVAHT